MHVRSFEKRAPPFGDRLASSRQPFFVHEQSPPRDVLREGNRVVVVDGAREAELTVPHEAAGLCGLQGRVAHGRRSGPTREGQHEDQRAQEQDERSHGVVDAGYVASTIMNQETPLPAGSSVVVHALGETPLEAIEQHLSLEAMPPPDTSTLAPDDVVVRIESASVGWVDLLMTSGQYQHPVQPPYTPGLEYAGVVVWAGPSAGHVHLGDRVLVDGFLAGPRSSGAYQRYGGFASYAVAPARAVHLIPGDLSFDQACNLLGNFETAYHCLVTRGRLQPGETALVLGASGSTGLAAVQVAKLIGAKVIAVGRSQAKLDVVAQQGADHTVSCAPLESSPEGGARSFRDDVKALTGGRGVDVVYDGVGGDLSLEALRCVRFGARFLVVGWASTPFVARGQGQRGAPRANVLPTNLLMMKGLDVLGCPTVIATVDQPTLRPPRLEQIFTWVKQGRLRPYVSHVFALRDFKQAMLAKWHGEVVGGAVLHPW